MKSFRLTTAVFTFIALFSTTIYAASSKDGKAIKVKSCVNMLHNKLDTIDYEYPDVDPSHDAYANEDSDGSCWEQLALLKRSCQCPLVDAAQGFDRRRRPQSAPQRFYPGEFDRNNNIPYSPNNRQRRDQFEPQYRPQGGGGGRRPRPDYRPQRPSFGPQDFEPQDRPQGGGGRRRPLPNFRPQEPDFGPQDFEPQYDRPQGGGGRRRPRPDYRPQEQSTQSLESIAKARELFNTITALFRPWK